MRWMLIVLLSHMLWGCSSVRPKTTPALPEEEVKSQLVSVGVTLEHIFQSYRLGCVEAFRTSGRKNTYLECGARAKSHADAVENLLRLPTKEKK
ncbi:MAG: hypothetical protein ACLGG7_13665 [Bacteriovoracia bacterium]